MSTIQRLNALCSEQRTKKFAQTYSCHNKAHHEFFRSRLVSRFTTCIQLTRCKSDTDIFPQKSD